jgi:hypothetical protein
LRGGAIKIPDYLGWTISSYVAILGLLAEQHLIARVGAKTRGGENREFHEEGREAVNSLKRWRRIGEGQFHKWATPGGELEGVWQGTYNGRFGLVGTLDGAEGLFTFPLPTALRDRLQRVRPGTEVLIRYTGLQTSKGGRLFKAFEVYVAGDESREQPEHAPLALVRAKEG